MEMVCHWLDAETREPEWVQESLTETWQRKVCAGGEVGSGSHCRGWRKAG